MQGLESSHSRYMINSCTCFSHLSLCKTKAGDWYIFSAACGISNSLQNEVQTAKKKAGFLITLRYNLQGGSFTALINEVSKL